MNLFFNLVIFFTFIFVFPNYAFSQIKFNASGKWSTTFDYGPCSQRGACSENPTDCAHVEDDGIIWSWGAASVEGKYTSVVAEANYPGGEGGNGARFWIGEGKGAHTGEGRVNFPEPQKELWVRWYVRYELGFNWSIQHYEKLIYLYSAGPYLIPGMVDGDFYIHSSGHPSPNLRSSLTWNDHMNTADNTANGEWTCWEMHIKMDTDGTNGIARLWIDGNLVLNRTNINHSGGNTSARDGWTWFEFTSNQNRIDNRNGPIGLSYAYIDYDDIVIYNKTPPNIDDHGNPFIGPLPPAPPWGLTIDVQ